MKCKTIAFGDDSLFTPKKIHAVTIDLRLEFELRQLAVETKAQHLCFENTLGLLSVQRPTLKKCSQRSDAGPTLTCVGEEAAPSSDDRQLVGDEKMFEHARRERRRPRSSIEQRPKRTCHRNVTADISLDVIVVGRAVQHRPDDVPMSWPRRCHDVNRGEERNRHAMQPRCSWSPGHCIVTACHNSSCDSLHIASLGGSQDRDPGLNGDELAPLYRSTPCRWRDVMRDDEFLDEQSVAVDVRAEVIEFHAHVCADCACFRRKCVQKLHRVAPRTLVALGG